MGQRIYLGMDELHEFANQAQVQQTRYRFLGTDEAHKIGDG